MAGVSSGRLEAFSDGVFSIAATLLVLELRVPPDAAGGLGPALLAEWPSYASYVVSFLTIGIIWVNHHALFANVRRVDRRPTPCASGKPSVKRRSGWWQVAQATWPLALKRVSNNSAWPSAAARGLSATPGAAPLRRFTHSRRPRSSAHHGHGLTALAAASAR
jgi:hypothetical protein